MSNNIVAVAHSCTSESVSTLATYCERIVSIQFRVHKNAAEIGRNNTRTKAWLDPIPDSTFTPRLQYSAQYTSTTRWEPPVDDLSCVPGCMDPMSFNFDSRYNEEDGSCVPIVLGCTNRSALNFDPLANTDAVNGTDGTYVRGFLHLPENGTDLSCIPNITGCTDPIASNFDAAATWDDRSCVAAACSALQAAPAHPSATCSLIYSYDADGVGFVSPIFTCTGDYVPNQT